LREEKCVTALLAADVTPSGEVLPLWLHYTWNFLKTILKKKLNFEKKDTV